MATSEIEKLERRYAENPHGLTFAPLAEVHRKNGDVARALELLVAGLELHPNYIPASIVLGRCHQDTGDLPAAETAFAHVLRLDDENVIALKSLADINEKLERFDVAENWLRRLMSVDRSNDEAREQLRRVETAKNGQSAAAAKSKLEQLDPSTTEEISERPKRPSAEVVALDLPPVDIAALDLIEPAPEPAPVAEAPPPLPVLERTPEFSEELVAEKAPSITDAPEPVAPDSVQPVAGLISQEFEPPQGPVGTPPEPIGIDIETSEEVMLEGSGMSEFRVPDATEDLREAVAARPIAGGPGVAPDTPVKASEKPSYVARDTNGQSVAAFFRTMLAARPPGSATSPPSQPAEEAPSRLSQDGLSLSAVPGPDSSPAPPAVGGSEPTRDGDVSFDDFFSSKIEKSAAEKGSEPGKDDLDQFHSWLQNLKR